MLIFKAESEVAYSDYTETYPGLYESNNMQPVGKNDLVAQGVTQGTGELRLLKLRSRRKQKACYVQYGWI